ncbi:hypothetical protein BJY16_004412 [Actinoplanes octamycinicus]|uniref:DUF5666 domain-containing protein n=1 Tax=Actinoplanes octamycinicus TaxID=135948 RepID=A0A7W7GZ51_9ACTN|nr:hypothetical protein [Actinoplanes octamycinicus]MBB4740953.1 hypothetical protein [Actinoplanes octamycinicus]
MNDETALLPAVPAPAPADADADADHEGLAEELAAAAPKKWWNKGTIGLGVGLLLMGGFLGGVHAQKQWGTSTATTAGFPGGGTRGSGNFPGGLSASGFPGFGQGAQGGGTGGTTTAAAAGTTGKVKLVNGKTIYVETADGTVVTVKTDGSTAVSTAKKGKLSDVKAGDSVTVEGAAGADGAVTATSVTARGK